MSIVAPLLTGHAVCYENNLECHLRFINLEFILPSKSPMAPSSILRESELAAFSRIEVTPNLWHAWLGHAGGDFVKRLDSITTGVGSCSGELGICKACIIGKHL